MQERRKFSKKLVLAYGEKKEVMEHFAKLGIVIKPRTMYDILNFRNDSETARMVRDYLTNVLRIKTRRV